MAKQPTGEASASHNYPKKRKPTGARPNAGRPSDLVNPARLSVWIEQDDKDWLAREYASFSEAIRALIANARKGQG